MATYVTATPSDYHNTLADIDVQPTSSDPSMPARMTELELSAFEKGRLQGEVEAVRRLEAEGQLNNKTFVTEQTIVQQNLSQASVVEIQRLSITQRLAALVGEIASAGYIVLMAIWISEYRGGVDWSDSDHNANPGMFNVHVLTGFSGLWCAAQAYSLYRMMPLYANVAMNKAIYVTLHLLAMTAFALSIASATKAQPGKQGLSMHAWTAYLAVFAYACHAIYSSAKVIFAPAGVSAHNWNETRNTSANEMSPDQRRDYLNDNAPGLPPMYRAAPIGAGWGRSEYNQDGTIKTEPVWSESKAFTANNFFLVPRAKWAVASLIGLLTVVLVGLGEWQVLLAGGANNWSQNDSQPNRNGVLNFDGTESYIIGTIGLATLAGTAALCYVAMPPRTILAKGNLVAANPPLTTTTTTVTGTGAADSMQPADPIAITAPPSRRESKNNEDVV